MNDGELRSQLYAFLGGSTSNADGDAWSHDQLRSLVDRLIGLPAVQAYGRDGERMAWEKALTDSHLPNVYVRLVRDLALAPCDNCGGHVVYCSCDDS